MTLGVAVVTRDGIGAPPDPIDDPEQDWYFWDHWTGDLMNSGQSNFSRSFDIRSKRRLRQGYRLVLITQNTAQEFAHSVNFAFRTLWQMP